MATSNGNITSFETGKSYTYGFIGDSSIKVKITIQRRTAKTVWFTERDGKEVKQCRVSVYGGVEQISPCGRYSMSPICSADKSFKETAPAPAPVAEVVEEENPAAAPKMEVVHNVRGTSTPTPQEETTEQEVVAGLTNSDVRGIMARVYVEELEAEGMSIMVDSIYGTFTSAHTATGAYTAMNADMKFSTTSREAFVRFIESSFLFEELK